MSVTDKPVLRANRMPDWLRGGVGVVLGLVALMWLVEIVDTAAQGDLDGHGIRPRSVEGIDGIVWAPFLHGGFGHLISNTIPFVVLSGLTLTQGLRLYAKASLIIVGLGGLLLWLFAFGGNENHIGASGWVFGLFGYLLASAWYRRRPLPIAVAVVALVLYGGTVLFGLVPRTGISWEGHIFGFVAGVVAARVLVPRPMSQTESVVHTS